MSMIGVDQNPDCLSRREAAPDKKAALKARQAKREMDRIRKGDRD